MSYCDADPPDFYTYSEPLARKAHRCCECRAPILRGEKHLHARGKWYDTIESFRQHLLCCEACELIRDRFFVGNCICFGGLKDEFADMRSDNWYQERDRYKEPWKQLRSLMARILWRERRASNGGT